MVKVTSIATATIQVQATALLLPLIMTRPAPNSFSTTWKYPVLLLLFSFHFVRTNVKKWRKTEGKLC